MLSQKNKANSPGNKKAQPIPIGSEDERKELRKEKAGELGVTALKGATSALKAAKKMVDAAPVVATALSVLGGVTSLAGAVITQALQAQANKAQCRRLAERLGIVKNAIEGLDVTPQPQRYIRVLRQLEQTLLECQTVVEKLSGRRWFKRVLSAGSDKETFEKLYRQLAEQITDLQLGVNVQQLMNAEENQADAEKDRETLKANQKEIIRLNKDLKEEMQQHGLNSEEQYRILCEQLASMQTQLSVFTQKHKVSRHTSSHGSQLMAAQRSVPFHTLDIEAIIAKGQLSTVYRGRWHEQTVAIKVLKGHANAQDKTDFLREVAITQRLNSPHVVQLYGACTDGEHLALISEHMAGGTLANYLKTHAPLTVGQQRRLGIDLAQGLHYLHEQGMCHRDVSDTNVLMNAQGQGKLTDFGLVKTKSNSIQTLGERYEPVQIWGAPELSQRGGLYTQKADMYGWGMLVWAIVTGLTPTLASDFSADVTTAASHRQPDGTYLIPESTPAVLRTLMLRCWSENPQARPTAKEVIHTLRKEERVFYTMPQANACYGLHPEALYQRGLASQKALRLQEAEMYFSRSAEMGYVRAQTELGLLYVQHNHPPTGGTASGKEQGYRLLLMSAQQNHARAMSNVGYQLEKGDGVPQSVNKALFWYKTAAEQGDRFGQNKVAQLRQQQKEASSSP